MSIEPAAIYYENVSNALVEWGSEASATVIVDVVSGGGRVLKITAAALAEKATAETLSEGTIYDVTDTGILVVPSSTSTFREYRPAYIGPDAPDDTSAVWFQTT